MDVHETDFAAEEGGRFCPPKYGFDSAAIGKRPVHEAGAVGKQEMLANDREMASRLAGVKSPPIIACVIGISEKESPVRSSLG